MSMLISAYSRHGAKVILDPPKVTPEFRVKVARWAITQNASPTEVAAEFGYIGTAQILTWKKIYRQKGPNGLLSITKGRKPIMTKNDCRKKAAKLMKILGSYGVGYHKQIRKYDSSKGPEGTRVKTTSTAVFNATASSKRWSVMSQNSRSSLWIFTTTKF